MNVVMMVKIHKIFKARQQKFLKRESLPAIATIDQASIHHLFPKTFDHYKHRKSMDPNEIMHKVIKKWWVFILRSAGIFNTSLDKKLFTSRKYRDERKAKRKFTQSTTLVYIVLTHIVLTMPANITYICLTVPNDSAAHIYDVSEKYPTLDSFASVTYVMYVLGHAINHILYCLTNKQIQDETWKMILRCKNLYWTK